MRRAVVSVGTNRYSQGMLRLIGSVVKYDPDCNFAGWTSLPDDWPTHEAKPYAFKAHALQTASLGADLLLWADAAVVVVKPLAPLWERIEQDGYWISCNGWTNYEWTADSAYPDLFPHLTLETARIVNKRFPQVLATTFGLNVKHPIGRKFLEEYFRLSNTNAFCGPWTNTNNPDALKHWRQDAARMGPCGPPDVIGHRHDQTAASVLAWHLQMKLTSGEIFGYPPGDAKTILMAVGA